MLPVPLAIKPGVDTQRTALQVGGGITQASLIRQRDGYIEKLAGCTHLTSTGLLVGTARQLFAWADLVGNAYAAAGTNEVVQVFTAGTLNLISPVVHTSNLAATAFVSSGSSSPFTVTITDAGASPQIDEWIDVMDAIWIPASGSTPAMILQGLYQIVSTGGSAYTIQVTNPNFPSGSGGSNSTINFAVQNGQHGATITLGNFIFVNNQNINVGVSTTVGGITFLGQYVVAVSGSTATIQTAGVATSTTNGNENGGNVQVQYLLGLPPENFQIGSYGAGPYGGGQYGTGSPTGSPTLVEWSLDRFGQNLIAAYKGGTIYQWTPPVAPGNALVAVTGAPSAVNGIMTALPEQQVFAWGAFSASLGEIDPMLLAFCDVANINSWTASPTNQAGTFRLSGGGSQIMGQIWFNLVTFIWTDVDVWVGTYIGFPLVWAFNPLARGCGLVSRRAVAILGSQIVWLSRGNFFSFNGSVVAPMPCTVRDFIFNNIDWTYAAAIHLDANSYGSEITAWFPTIGSMGVCNAYVKVNLQGLWDLGLDTGPPNTLLNIAAWTDTSPLGAPIGADYTGLLQQFETSTDFDGQILPSFFLTGWFDLANGLVDAFVERILPDFKISEGGILTITLFVIPEMGQAPVQYGPFNVVAGDDNYPLNPLVLSDAGTAYIIPRIRGRFIRMLVESSTLLGTFWRYGTPPAQAAVDGRRT